MRVLLTRPQAASEDFAARLPAGIKTLISPVLQIQHRSEKPDLTGIDALAFTSRNGVEAFAATRPPTNIRAFCVGDATAELARGAGLDAISAQGDVEALLALITKQKPSNLLHIRGAHSRGDLTARLTQAGLNARDHVLYDQLQMPLNAEARALLFGPDTVIMPLFSPRSAALVAQQLSGSSRGPMTGRHIALCLSQNVASACGEGIFGSIEICAAPNAASMVAHLETYAAE